jgi:signal transduction histidine kinase/ActR/RegA family two-component response regulator
MKRIVKRMKRIVEWLDRLGTSGIYVERERNRISLLSRLSAAVGILILILAPPICRILHWRADVTIGISIDFAFNWLAFFLNCRKKHQAAGIVFFLTQCIAILYFGTKLGELFHLQFMIMFLVSIIYLLFEDKLSRHICLAGAVATFVIVQLSYYLNPVDTVPMGRGAGYAIQSSVIGAILVLMIIVSRRYVMSNDTNMRLTRGLHFMKIFTAQVSHELRTPLDAIHQTSQLLKEEIGNDPVFDKIRVLVDISYTASSSATNIVNNVLDMAEIEQGKMPVIPEESFHLVPLLEKIVDVHKVIASREVIDLRLRVDPQLPPVIMGDPLSINQILTNLLSNALKYGATGNTVEIDVRREGAHWAVRVSNYGKVIPQEKIGVLFDPFFTGKSGHIQGSGLGLYIVKNKVTSMNGTVSVESRPSGLTTFTVILPLREGVKVPEPAVTEPDGNGQFIDRVNVLIAEDSKVNAFVLSRFLADMGCACTVVNNGQELLDAANKKCPDECPDLIIMDHNMPVLNGEETIRQLKRDPRLGEIPIIIITGDVFSDTMKKLKAAGATTLLKKPVDHLVLQKTIRRCLKENSLN